MDRITVNPAQCGGMACIRGMRIPVVSVLKMLASNMTPDEILHEYPDLETEDIHACLEYAAWLASEKSMPLAVAGAIITVEDTRFRIRPLPINLE
jgi:uncharacterized protein (DUF433 family)